MIYAILITAIVCGVILPGFRESSGIFAGFPDLGRIILGIMAVLVVLVVRGCVLEFSK